MPRDRDVQTCRFATMQLVGVVWIVGILLISSCGGDVRVDGLQKQVQEMGKNLEELRKDIQTLKNDASWDRFARDIEKVAYLTPADGGYSVLQTDFGPLTVTLEDVRPYANGSRVTLKFGNPTSATLTNVSAMVDWGSVDEKGSPKNDDARSKEVPLSESLRAGHWTTVNLVLENVPPTGLGFVRVHDLKNKGIVLYR